VEGGFCKKLAAIALGGVEKLSIAIEAQTIK
jgi:hypothetical protein